MSERAASGAVGYTRSAARSLSFSTIWLRQSSLGVCNRPRQISAVTSRASRRSQPYIARLCLIAVNDGMADPGPRSQ